MQPVRILIVDDSIVFRKVLSDLLASDPEIVVAGTAGNGSQALARIPEIKPDLVTLDIDMPGRDGMEALDEIRKLYPKLPVIMFSTLTERGATATLDALARGASDYVAKPSPSETPERSHVRVRKELIRRIKSLGAECAPGLQPRPASAAVSVHPQPIVQDEESSVVWGMPGNVLPPDWRIAKLCVGCRCGEPCPPLPACEDILLQCTGNKERPER